MYRGYTDRADTPMSGEGTRQPAAELGLLDATMIGMGAMVGAGIFVLTGLAAEIAGTAAIVVFGLNGVVTAFTGLSYAEIAAAIPKSGGGYAFVREVFGDAASFVMGWMLWFAYMIAAGCTRWGSRPTCSNSSTCTGSLRRRTRSARSRSRSCRCRSRRTWRWRWR
jgi:hypothetical protein